MPIYRSGYRSQADKQELARFYNSAAWKRTRAAVLERAGGLCEWCGEPADGRHRLDVVHLASSTLELLRGAGDPLNPAILAAGHRKCHAAYAAGNLGLPPGRRR